MSAPQMPSSNLNATIRVTGIRQGRFVEFDYSVADRDLSVELIMPFDAFAEFSTREGTTVLPPVVGLDLPAHTTPGLYRSPMSAANEALDDEAPAAAGPRP